MSTSSLAVVAGAAVLVVGATGCSSTQDQSARLAAMAKGSLHERGVTVGATNPDIRVLQAAVVQDATGVAAVVRLRNVGSRAEARLPIGITVADAAGKALYRNDVPGLDPSLTSVGVIEAGGEALWVNNQIAVAGKARRLEVRVGRTAGQAPADVPQLTVTGVTGDADADGEYAHGSVQSTSPTELRRVAVACVTTHGTRIVGAGRAILERVAPGRPAVFTAYVVGRARGGSTACVATPDVDAGGAG